MNIMDFSKQVFVVLLCCSLVGFTAQADAYDPMSQSNEQQSTSPAKESPH